MYFFGTVRHIVVILLRRVVLPRRWIMSPVSAPAILTPTLVPHRVTVVVSNGGHCNGTGTLNGNRKRITNGSTLSPVIRCYISTNVRILAMFTFSDRG